MSQVVPDSPNVSSLNSEDASLVLHDARVGNGMSAVQGTVEHTARFTGVQYHPVLEHFFATSDTSGRVCLHDTRMAFGSSSKRSNQGIVRVVRLHS